MRIKYYIRLIRQMNKRRSFVFIAILFMGIVGAIYLLKTISPIIDVACQSKAKAIGIQITEETVKEYVTSIDYNSLMNISYNKEGKIIAINANIVELNKLSSEIAYRIQEKLSKLERVNVKIPLGKLMGLNILSGYGPNITIKLMPMGNIETDFNSEFVSQGINQTKHTIYMNIKSLITVVAPFMGKSVECNSTITIAETIIIGDIPATYYNIQGIEDAPDEAMLNVIGE